MFVANLIIMLDTFALERTAIRVHARVFFFKDNMGVFKDLTGQRFGKLTVVKRVDNDKHNNACFLCLCDCGIESIVIGTQLSQGKTMSCGKCSRTITSKYSNYINKPFWKEIGTSYRAMKERCYNKNNGKYNNYGGRGITICDEWNGTNGRIRFYEWAISNGYAKKLTIDRIDVNGNYEPNNCRWANTYLQANNRTDNFVVEYNGEVKTIHEWEKLVGISAGTIRYRITHNWSVEKALTIPAIIGRNQVGKAERIGE